MPRHAIRTPQRFSTAPHPIPVRPRRDEPSPRRAAAGPESVRSRLVALILPGRPAADDRSHRLDEMLGALDSAIARSAHRGASA